MAATYTVRQVAEILGFSTNSIYSFLKEKRLKGVRVGKGRFRIPQSELDRILLTKTPKSTAIEPASLVESIAPLANSRNKETHGVSLFRPHLHTSVQLLRNVRMQIPTLFDWFVGTASIVTGLALFLFNQSFQGAQLPAFLPVIYSARLILIVAGLGVLGTAMVIDTRRFWHSLFLGVLASSGAFLSYLLFRNGDIDGALIYGLLSLVVTVSLFIEFSDITIIGMYLAGLSVAVPVSILLGSADEHVIRLLSFTKFSPSLAVIFSGIVSLFYIGGILWGLSRSRSFLWGFTWLSTLGIIVVSFFYAQDSYWSRAFFFVVLALATGFMPMWHDLRNSRLRSTQIAIMSVFVGSLGFLILAVAGIYIIQVNARDRITQSLESRSLQAVNVVESTLEEAQNGLISAATNPQLIQAVSDGDVATINAISKLMYESNSTIRRYIYLDAEGNGLALYPFGTFDVPNFASRDYYIETKRTGNVYITDVFTAQSDQSQRKVVVVAVPMIDTEGQFVGVITGSIDFDHLNARLQKIADGQNNEYVSIVDSNGIYLINPMPSLVGTELIKGSPIWKALKGQAGVEVWRGGKNGESLVAYQPIALNSWGLSVKAPLVDALGLVPVANTLLFIIIASIILIDSFILLHARLRDARGSFAGDSP